MFILGINAYHGDSSAAIIKDGVVIAAAEEERFRRIKHWAGLPVKSIDFCLEYAGICFSEVDHVAVNSDNSSHRRKKLAFLLSSPRGIKLAMEKILFRSRKNKILLEIEKHSSHQTGGCKVHHIEHHLSHLASAFYPSGFDSAALLSIDGFGDFSSAAWGTGIENNINVNGYTTFPHSMGIFYQAITQFLGFPDYGDEYKVMGLASHGQPEFIDQMREIVGVNDNGEYMLTLDYFRHHRESLAFNWTDGIPKFDNLYSEKLEGLLGKPRHRENPIIDKHKNIAASAQLMYEEVFFKLLNRLHRDTKTENLALAGGCAMNSVANGKIIQKTGFRNIYVQPAAGDAGGAIGAALVVWKNLKGNFDDPVMPDAYLGPEFNCENIRSILNAKQLELDHGEFDISQWQEPGLIEYVAEKLAAGCVVGWFQGRMEWGARALGNRSILADPRISDMQELLNHKIKRRESFRPFAPSILREHVAIWFEVDDDVPFMEKVYPVRRNKQDAIPAVTHVDGTGRLQTVDMQSNPRYYNLINAFYKLTNVPILLNTSFNENEPIVCTPEEALDCFLRTKMDVLVLENYSISRRITK